jgi:3D (Asp-Asp-Asp) domain-containing protein
MPLAIIVILLLINKPIINNNYDNDIMCKYCTITHYYNNSKTASSTPPKIGTVAISRDLFKHYQFGDKVIVDGKKYIINDLIDKKFTNRIDIWHPDRKICIKKGKYKTTVKFIKNKQKHSLKTSNKMKRRHSHEKNVKK